MKFSFLRTLLDMRFPAAAMAVVLAAGLAACASGNADDAGLKDGPRKTGQYPNINIERQAATAQMTPGERQAIERELGAGNAQAGVTDTNAAAEVARLGTLAERHGGDTLKQIEDGE